MTELLPGGHMENQNTQGQETNPENTSFYDKQDEKFKQDLTQQGDDTETGGKTYSKNLMNKAEEEVRENEDASLQDDSYAFDEDNTDNEEYHDVDLDNDEDFVQ